MVLHLLGWTAALIVGVVILVKGADFLVDGAGKTAAYLGVPAIVIGLTLVSFGTSLPELAGSLNAIFKGKQGISVGNVIGSNIANILLVLGASSLIKPISVDRNIIKREIPIMFGAMALLILFSSNILASGYVIEGWEGILLLLAFIGYIGFFIWIAYFEGEKEIIKEELEIEEEIKDEDYVQKEEYAPKINIAKIVFGLLGIAIGAELMIDGAIFYMDEFGLKEGVVGLTIIALATSLPELAASSMAAYKDESDISLGNVIGSNTFNILMVLGICATFVPLDFSPDLIYSMLIMVIVSIILTIFMYTGKKISRLEGIVMLAGYVLYMSYQFLYIQ
ncbi:MAG: calcium/sodium antiporter [Thermoplasmatota archaeon]